jgi:hypothetical protein
MVLVQLTGDFCDVVPVFMKEDENDSGAGGCAATQCSLSMAQACQLAKAHFGGKYSVVTSVTSYDSDLYLELPTPFALIQLPIPSCSAYAPMHSKAIFSTSSTLTL